MNHCRPIKWLPGSLPGEVEAALRSRLDAWSSAWGAPRATAVTAQVLPADVHPAAGRCVPWADLPGDWLTALSRTLLGAGSTASAVARGAVREAADELQQALRQQFNTQPGSAFSPARVGHGGIEARFDLLDVRFGFVLDLAELQAGGWLAAPEPARLAAVALESAVSQVAVPLRAAVGHASASVTDVLQLQPGDVLLLAETLDAPLQVVSPGSTLRLSAHLGASAATSSPARRALRWLAT